MCELRKKEFVNRKAIAHKSTMEELKREIDNHEVVSFDIFDTLVIRRTLFPQDVFDLVQCRAYLEGMNLYNFCELRQRAQSENKKSNPNLYDIYESFQELCGTNNYVRERVCQLELEVERDVLKPRLQIINAMQYARAAGKKVYLVSDMYIPERELRPVLNDMGIDSYDDILISCDYKKLKLEGLFTELKVKTGSASCLHVGDHYLYDGLYAEKEGIDSFLIDSPLELMKKSSWGKIFDHLPDSVNERSLLGFVISELFADPFVLEHPEGHGAGFFDKGKMLGLLVAPIVTTYMDWFVKRVQNRGYEAILFAARDGFLIKKLYEIYREKLQLLDLPEGIYFQTSRKVASATDMDNEAMINTLIGIRDVLSPEQVLERLFSLDKKDIVPFPENADWDKEIYHYVWKHQNAIFKRAAAIKRNYFRYMGHLNLKMGKKYLFYDFVSSGTTQRILKKMVPFELEGLYFGWNSLEDKEALPVKAMFDLSDNSFFMKNYKLLEVILTSDQPSLSSIDENGQPVLGEETRNLDTLKFLLEVQQFIISFLEDFLENLYIPYGDFSRETGERILQCMNSLETGALRDFVNQLNLVDDWKGTDNSLGELLAGQ